jgi:hypothetical protein
VSNLNLLAGVQNPFLWESDEMESVESWLGVLICRAGGAVAEAVSEVSGQSVRDARVGRAKKYVGAEAAATAVRGVRPGARRVARASR